MLDDNSCQNGIINNIKIPEKTLNELYKDALHPAAKEVGKLLAKPFHFANWITDCAKDFVSSRLDNTKQLQKEVQQRIDLIPEGELYEPPKDIVLPALMANTYIDDKALRSLYANLITNSMNAKYRGHAHPAFVEIIKQLSSEEALVLQKSSFFMESMPSCQVRVQKKSEYDNINDFILSKHNIIRRLTEGQTLLQYYLPYVQGVPAKELEFMINNFIRLQLITSPPNQILTQKKAYELYYKDMFMDYIEKRIDIDQYPEYEIAHIMGVIVPTAFGKRFYEVCVK